jgi:hypothetical protein
MKGPTIKMGNRVARYPRKGEAPKPLVTVEAGSQYDDMTKAQLYALAKKRSLRVTTKLTKDALITALEEG